MFATVPLCKSLFFTLSLCLISPLSHCFCDESYCVLKGNIDRYFLQQSQKHRARTMCSVSILQSASFCRFLTMAAGCAGCVNRCRGRCWETERGGREYRTVRKWDRVHYETKDRREARAEYVFEERCALRVGHQRGARGNVPHSNRAT